MKTKRTLYVKGLKFGVILLVVSFLLLPLSAIAQEDVTPPYVFEQGLNGYFGVIDTSIVDSPVGVGNWGTFYPNAPADDAPLLLSGINRQTLIQFLGIFGALPGQIPYGSTIDSATLEFGSREGSTQTHELYMMISSWEGSITWNSAGSGIQMDGMEASSSVVDSISPVLDGGSFDVTSSVSDWSSGTPNNGWVLTGTTADDWTMFSSESLTAPGTNPSDQGPIPRLTITVADPAPVPDPSTMHIESIRAGTYKGKYGKATVTVFDDYGNPVPAAEVTGKFSLPFDETGSGVTNESGVAVIYTTEKFKKPSYEFCVDDIVKGTLTYEPNDNVETCESR